MPTAASIRSYLHGLPWPLLLVWSCVALLPVGRTVEIPVAVMAVYAGSFWYKGKIKPIRGRYRSFTLVFLLFWIPMMLSVPDAFEPFEAVRVTALYLRFFFAGLFVIWAIDSPEKRDLLLKLTCYLLLFWTADAVFQFFAGFNSFGYPLLHQLTGVFGRHLKLGITLAILSPFIISWSMERWPNWVSLLILTAIVFVIIAAGTRSGWVMFGVILLAYGLSYLNAHKEKAAALIVIALFTLAATATVSYKYFDSVSMRVDQTLLLFSGDREKLDVALSYRLPIWNGAWNMIRNHPVNGVGTRNYRDAYRAHVEPDDYYNQINVVPSHPHQYLLEIASETGLIGISCLILIFLRFIKQWKVASPLQRKLSFPVAVSMLALWFPINTHHAFYSSAAGQMVWWLVALYFALLSATPHEEGKTTPVTEPGGSTVEKKWGGSA
jgi:O-antigen ligase